MIVQIEESLTQTRVGEATVFVGFGLIFDFSNATVFEIIRQAVKMVPNLPS